MGWKKKKKASASTAHLKGRRALVRNDHAEKIGTSFIILFLE